MWLRRIKNSKYDVMEEGMTMNRLGKWCYWQTECSDFDGFACMASSASGHVFVCTFKEDGEFFERGTLNNRPWRSPIHPTGGGLCEDFRSPEDEI